MSFDWLPAIDVDLDWGDGQHPTPSYFRRKESIWQGSYPHDNPRFYKYIWQIFTEADLPPAAANWSCTTDAVWWAMDQPTMSIAQAMPVIKRLFDAGTPMIVRNQCLKRLGPHSPWDDEKIKWDHPAPAYDDDPDPAWHGYK